MLCYYTLKLHAEHSQEWESKRAPWTKRLVCCSGFNFVSRFWIPILVSCLETILSCLQLACGTQFDLGNSHHSLCNVSDSKWAVTSVSKRTQQEAIRGVTSTFVCLFFYRMTERLTRSVVFTVFCYIWCGGKISFRKRCKFLCSLRWLQLWLRLWSLFLLRIFSFSRTITKWNLQMCHMFSCAFTHRIVGEKKPGV